MKLMPQEKKKLSEFIIKNLIEKEQNREITLKQGCMIYKITVKIRKKFSFAKETEQETPQ